jgi:mono/diheme cytochrome c family protein
MVRKLLKRIGIGLGVIMGLLIIAGGVLTLIGFQQANKVYAIDPAELSIPTGDDSLAEGERLLAIRACTQCHGADLSGGLLIDHPLFGAYYAANLTGGQNSVTVAFTAADWERAIRHGVKPDGRGMWAMPSLEYNRISDRDLALMIAYLESVPPVDLAEPYPEPAPTFVANLLIATGMVPLISAAEIDHAAQPASVTVAVSAEYGEYLALTCTGCHKPNLAGGASVGSDPDKPAPANLTPAGDLGNWTREEFITTLSTGVTPEGKTLDPDNMPWPITQRMTDDELSALWLYLSTLPPVETDS